MTNADTQQPAGQVTEAELKTMTAEQIEDARVTGRLDTLLGKRAPETL